MSLQYPEEDSQISSSDEEVLNPEDIDMDNTSESYLTDNESSKDNDAETEESELKSSEEGDSDDDYVEDDIFDATFLAEVEEVTQIHKYTEEDRGVPESMSSLINSSFVI